MIPIPPSITLKGIYAAAVAAVLALLVALLVVQTIRLEGFKFWPIDIEGSIAKANRLEADMALVLTAQEGALADAIEAKENVEREYRELAERIDDEQVRNVAAAADDTDRFVAARRVQSCPAASGAGEALASSDDHGAGISEPLPAGVVVGEADVRTCADLYAYAVSAHNWAAGLEE